MPEEKKDEKGYEVRGTIYMDDGRKKPIRATRASQIDAVKHAGHITGEVWYNAKYANAHGAHVMVWDREHSQTILDVETKTGVDCGTTVAGRYPSDVEHWAEAHGEIRDREIRRGI